jgi:hypothetical protein
VSSRRTLIQANERQPYDHHVNLRWAIAKSVVMLGAIVGAAVPTLPTPASASVPVLPTAFGSGVYAGPAQVPAAASFGQWRGKPVDFAVDYLDKTSWNNIEKPMWWVQRWSASRTPLVLGVPMLLNDTSTTIQRGANGEYDNHFRELARTLVQYGYGSTVLRIGWEMNGDWYRWSAKRDPAAWRIYYRRIVNAMRSVTGQSFRFDWTMNLGPSAMPAMNAYPGDGYVDYIGIDVYDWKWNAPLAAPAQRWAWIKAQPYGLDWFTSFAWSHRKPMTVPEWGLARRSEMQNGGGGDDPLFIRNMLSWMKQHGVLYESYFNTQTHSISNSVYPNAARVYQSLINQ